MVNFKLTGDKLSLNGQLLEPSQERPLSELKSVLKDPDSTGPDPVYLVYRDIDDPSKPEGMRADITVLWPGTIGTELTKTHGHYHIGDGVEPYQLLSGSGILLIQKPDFNYEGLEAVRLVKLVPNQPIEVPSGWGHTLVNIGSEPLVTLNYQDPEIQPLYSAFDKKRGAAYYVLADPAGMKLEANPSYGHVPKLQTF